MAESPADAIRSWRALIDTQSHCAVCVTHSLLDPHAFPLFGRFRSISRFVLFVYEAPNRGDTVDPQKGYLTVDAGTDPSGAFASELLTTVLGLSQETFQITNAVLCLPVRHSGKHPVTQRQMRLCSQNLRHQIEVLDPIVVASVGGRALAALNLISQHPYRTMNAAVGRPVQWFGRWLYPLFHTGMLGRNGPHGRSATLQRHDWQALRTFLRDVGAMD